MKTKTVSLIFLLVVIDGGLCLNETWTKNAFFERKFIRDLEDFIENQESVLQYLRKKLLNFKVERNDAEENPQMYFANELNQFLTLKRLVLDTSKIVKKSLEVAENFKAKVDSIKKENSFPSQNDLMSSALSLATLQRSQNFQTEKLAKGIFGNVKIR